MGLAGGNISFVARAGVEHDGTVACHDALIPGAGKAVSSLIDEDTVAMLLTSNEHAVVRASLGVPALDAMCDVLDYLGLTIACDLTSSTPFTIAKRLFSKSWASPPSPVKKRLPSPEENGDALR